MHHSSSGQGRRPLKAEITGSNPVWCAKMIRILHIRCVAYLDPDKQKAASHKSYLRNKDKIAERNKAGRVARVKYVQEYKLAKGCDRCGYSKSALALDLHHKSGKEGVESCISRLTARRVAWQRLYNALELCEVICANCHRELHAA